MAEKGLGKGFGALFGDYSELDSDGVFMLPISKVEPRENQPRSEFDEAALADLAVSVESYGVLQPIVVRKSSDGYYQIIAGERRWRAARMAGLQRIPVRVVDADDKKMTELALVENLQREDLNPVEEARGYKTLTELYGMTQEEIAGRIGKSRPAIANALRLLDLDDRLLGFVSEGALSAGHARALLPVKDPDVRFAAAREVINKNLSVRRTETLAAALCRPGPASAPVKNGGIRVNYIEEAENRLAGALGRRITIKTGKDKGKIELEYYGKEDMEFLLEALCGIGKAVRSGKNPGSARTRKDSVNNA
ncbi:MAG: ParB/RepB/Spo0J family partition protein [Oscillospiraceae bacterium]|nr:ParB/RepB/Spo0J family partition protein [Oscillospiraceae bacterium]